MSQRLSANEFRQYLHVVQHSLAQTSLPFILIVTTTAQADFCMADLDEKEMGTLFLWKKGH
jgi:hypothetical protein